MRQVAARPLRNRGGALHPHAALTRARAPAQHYFPVRSSLRDPRRQRQRQPRRRPLDRHPDELILRDVRGCPRGGRGRIADDTSAVQRRQAKVVASRRKTLCSTRAHLPGRRLQRGRCRAVCRLEEAHSGHPRRLEPSRQRLGRAPPASIPPHRHCIARTYHLRWLQVTLTQPVQLIPLRKRHSCLSAFPMFVPSLSW
jgi:hypothetical protein